MKIRPFSVELWMNRWENECRYNLAETCVESISVEALLGLANIRPDDFMKELMAMRLTYGAIEGSERLKGAIAALYTRARPDQVIVTHGAAGANYLAYQAVVEPGDVVVSIVPAYQQHTSIPESIGGVIREYRLNEEQRWLPDLAELAVVAKGAKVISIVNPNNPTGSLLDDASVRAIAQIARENDLWIIADEVYRGIDQHGSGTSLSFVDCYEKTIGVGSMSKAFSLAGLRLGWVVAPREALDGVNLHRDYSVISVGMIDDLLSCIALEACDALLERNRAIVRGNLAHLDAWVSAEPRMSFVKPEGGTIALLKYDAPMDSESFCLKLLEKTGVLFTPGSALDAEGYVRIGYANTPKVLREGLARVSEFLATEI